MERLSGEVKSKKIEEFITELKKNIEDLENKNIFQGRLSDKEGREKLKDRFTPKQAGLVIYFKKLLEKIKKFNEFYEKITQKNEVFFNIEKGLFNEFNEALKNKKETGVSEIILHLMKEISKVNEETKTELEDLKKQEKNWVKEKERVINDLIKLNDHMLKYSAPKRKGFFG